MVNLRVNGTSILHVFISVRFCKYCGDLSCMIGNIYNSVYVIKEDVELKCSVFHKFCKCFKNVQLKKKKDKHEHATI